MSTEPTCRCPNLRLRLLSPFHRPLAQMQVAIEGAQRRSFTTDGLGCISYHETEFSEDGKVYVEYDDGGRHLAWAAKLPTEPGSYDLCLNVWTNDPDGRE